MIDAQIFKDLSTKVEEDSARRDVQSYRFFRIRADQNVKAIKEAVKNLEQQNRETWYLMSQYHQMTLQQAKEFSSEVSSERIKSVALVHNLQSVANHSPYYRYNTMWSKELQEIIFFQLFDHWVIDGSDQSQYGHFLTLDELGSSMNLPVNLKDEDAFHITIEEYLHACITLVEELSRLATNSVIVGDFERPIRISKFVQSFYNGFRILNLKNDRLRQRYDALKYTIKKIENVVYDLKLRSLVPEELEAPATQEQGTDMAL